MIDSTVIHQEKTKYNKKPASQRRAKTVLTDNRDNKTSLAEKKENSPNNTQVIQNYRDMDRGLVRGYGKGSGPNAPTFAFQSTEATRTEDANTSVASYNAHSTQSFENVPSLKVSDNYDMAVPLAGGKEAKHFFATPTIVNASNLALITSGAPLRLLAGAGHITLPSFWAPIAGIILNQVSPVIAPGLLRSSECGVFAENILGINVNRIELDIAGMPTITTLPVRPARDAPLNNALGGRTPENVGANKNADPDIGDAFGILARSELPDMNLAMQLWRNITLVYHHFMTEKPNLQWGEHWAGVVAKSGGDYVTLENYNRAVAGRKLILAKLEQDYKEINAAGGTRAFSDGTRKYRSLANEARLRRLARLGRGYMSYGVQIAGFSGFYAGQLQNMWYFAMYGSKKGQTFHDEWKDSAPDAVTVKVPQ